MTFLYFFTDKIVAYFLVLTFSLYSALIAATLLVTNVRNPGAQNTQRKLAWVLLPVHLLFFTAIFCGATKELGAYCTEKVVFPWIFAAPASLMTILAIVYLNMYNLDFLLDWEPPVDQETRKKYGSAERVEKVQKVFASQSRRITCQMSWVFLMSVGTIVAGFVLSRFYHAIKCD